MRRSKIIGNGYRVSKARSRYIHWCASQTAVPAAEARKRVLLMKLLRPTLSFSGGRSGCTGKQNLSWATLTAQFAGDLTITTPWIACELRGTLLHLISTMCWCRSTVSRILAKDLLKAYAAYRRLTQSGSPGTAVELAAARIIRLWLTFRHPGDVTRMPVPCRSYITRCVATARTTGPARNESGSETKQPGYRMYHIV